MRYGSVPHAPLPLLPSSVNAIWFSHISPPPLPPSPHSPRSPAPHPCQSAGFKEDCAVWERRVVKPTTVICSAALSHDRAATNSTPSLCSGIAARRCDSCFGSIPERSSPRTLPAVLRKRRAYLWRRRRSMSCSELCTPVTDICARQAAL